jgi:hypothetical protein
MAMVIRGMRRRIAFLSSTFLSSIYDEGKNATSSTYTKKPAPHRDATPYQNIGSFVNGKVLLPPSIPHYLGTTFGGVVTRVSNALVTSIHVTVVVQVLAVRSSA